ncbi:MAG TPA: type IV pilus modification protein PilV [Terriglobales bacterium]|nr:type IV pilus modification protein PilV [Terriglobales bacterium]
MIPAQASRRNRNQCGFTLLEVLISMVVITIGLVSLLAVFATAMAATQDAQEDMIAKQLASEAMESIVTARDSAQITWAQINNVSNGGIFVDGVAPINLPGADGLVGTADDAVAGPEILTLPGPDGIVGTADDQQLSLANFSRTIAITPVISGGATTPDLRTVTITISYITPHFKATTKTYVLSDYISQYR